MEIRYFCKITKHLVIVKFIIHLKIVTGKVYAQMRKERETDRVREQERTFYSLVHSRNQKAETPSGVNLCAAELSPI